MYSVYRECQDHQYFCWLYLLECIAGMWILIGRFILGTVVVDWATMWLFEWQFPFYLFLVNIHININNYFNIISVIVDWDGIYSTVYPFSWCSKVEVLFFLQTEEGIQKRTIRKVIGVGEVQKNSCKGKPFPKRKTNSCMENLNADRGFPTLISFLMVHPLLSLLSWFTEQHLWSICWWKKFSWCIHVTKDLKLSWEELVPCGVPCSSGGRLVAVSDITNFSSRFCSGKDTRVIFIKVIASGIHFPSYIVLLGFKEEN